MRVIYRSASKLRLHSNIPSWLAEAARKATFLLLDKIGRGTLTRFISASLAWIVFAICFPFELILFTISWLHSIFILRLVKWLEPDANKVEINTSWTEDTDLATLMFTVESKVPDLQFLKDKIARLIHKAIMSHRQAKKLKCVLSQRLGCYVWNKDYSFSIDNHLVLASSTWRGVQIKQDNLRYWLNYICSQRLPGHKSPWQVTVVPYLDTTRTECYALLVRIHRLLVPFFKLSDALICQPSNFELKKAVAEALQFNDNKQRSCKAKSNFEESVIKLQRVVRIISKVLWVVWVTPRVIYKELLTSCGYAVAEHVQNESNKSQKPLFWSEDISKDLLSKLKEASGVSISGILMSCYAGALRQYRLQSGEQQVEDSPSILPFYSEDALSINSLLPNGFRSLALPVSIVDAVSRLNAVHKRLRSDLEKPAKRQISSAILCHLYPFIPPILISLASQLISKKYQTVIDNVFISDSSATIWDKKVTGVYFWRPVVSEIGSSVSFIHYEDKLSITVCTKRHVIQKPDLLVALFERQVNGLALALNVRIERKPTPPSSPTRIIKSFY